MSSRAMRSHAATCEAMFQQGRRDRPGRRDVRFDFMHWPRTPNSCLMPLIWCCFMAISVWSLALLASVPAVLNAEVMPSESLSINPFSLGGAADIVLRRVADANRSKTCIYREGEIVLKRSGTVRDGRQNGWWPKELLPGG